MVGYKFFQNFFTLTYMAQNEQRDEAVILSHICWSLRTPPPPPGRPQPPPPLPECGRVMGRSRRMA